MKTDDIHKDPFLARRLARDARTVTTVGINLVIVLGFYLSRVVPTEIGKFAVIALVATLVTLALGRIFQIGEVYALATATILTWMDKNQEHRDQEDDS